MPAPMMIPTMMQTESNTDNVFGGAGTIMETVRFLTERKQSDPLPEQGLSILIISFKGAIDAKKNFNSTLRDCIAAGERGVWGSSPHPNRSIVGRAFYDFFVNCRQICDEVAKVNMFQCQRFLRDIAVSR